MFFGALADIAGAEKIELQNIEDTEKLKEVLLRQYPLLKNKSYRIAVNKNLITKTQKLYDGDTAALLPPFAGG